MARCLFGARTSSEHMLIYCQLETYEPTSVKFHSKWNYFDCRNYIWKCRLQSGGHIIAALMWQNFALIKRFYSGWRSPTRSLRGRCLYSMFTHKKICQFDMTRQNYSKEAHQSQRQLKAITVSRRSRDLMIRRLIGYWCCFWVTASILWFHKTLPRRYQIHTGNVSLNNYKE